MMNKRIEDIKLAINTTGEDIVITNQSYFPYEPTPYPILKQLKNSGHINSNDVLMDYGCGKGRVLFYLKSEIGVKAIGVEYNKNIFDALEQNNKTAINPIDAFYMKEATTLDLEDDVTVIYFFSPFNFSVLIKVINKIYESFKRNNRTIKLIFYYPSKHYKQTLSLFKDIIHLEDIDCSNVVTKEDIDCGNGKEHKEEDECLCVYQITGE